MNKRITLFAALIACIAITSCTKKFIKGEGHVVTETRSLAEIDAVELNGSEDLQIISSTENKVEITGYHNLVPLYESYVRNGRLILQMDDDYINVRNNNIRVKLYTTGVNGIRINGSGDVVAGDNIGIQMSTTVNGSGNISFGDNHFTSLDITVNGSGAIDARRAESETVYADISGSGDIDVSVTKYLNAKISGSGTIDYWGNPTDGVDTEISGSGKVRRQ